MYFPSKIPRIKESAGEYQEWVQEYTEFKCVYIILNNYFIKYVRIEPSVVERKNLFIFKNKITFDLSPLNMRPKIQV